MLSTGVSLQADASAALVCAQKKEKIPKNQACLFRHWRCRRVCTCKETCRGHRRHLEMREQKERAQMKQRRKAPRGAPGHCSFKRFSSKTEDGEQCCAQITCSERSAGSGTVSSFSEPEERRRGNQRAPRRAEGGPRVKDRDTGGDKAPHPQEALDFTAPLAPRRRCDAKKKQKKKTTCIDMARA